MKATAEAASEAIGYIIIVFNMIFLIYFSLGLLYHMYFVLVPQRFRCAKVEEAGAAAHAAVKKLPMGEKLFPTHVHSLMDHYDDGSKLPPAHMRPSEESIGRTAERLVAQEQRDEAELAKQLGKEQGEAHRRVQERLLKKNKNKKKKKQRGASGKQGGGKGSDSDSDGEISIQMVGVAGKEGDNHPLTGRANVTVL